MPQEWIDAVCGYLPTWDESVSQADANMRALPMAAVRSAGNAAEVVVLAIEWARSCVDEYLAGRCKSGVFYAWFDELSDTLRFSFVSGACAEPPFRARVSIVDTALPIAEMAAAGGGGGVIPFDQLVSVRDGWVDGSSEDGDVIVIVYAVRLGAFDG